MYDDGDDDDFFLILAAHPTIYNPCDDQGVTPSFFYIYIYIFYFIVILSLVLGDDRNGLGGTESSSKYVWSKHPS